MIEDVIHEDVDPTEGRDNLVRRSLNLIGIGDIADDTERGAARLLDVGNDAIHIRGRD